MAILPNDSPLRGASGKLGGELVLKHYKQTGKTVVSKMPDMSRVKPSELQQLQRNIFSEASKYAQRINRNPELHAAYAKTLQAGESVFHKAKNEYLDKMKRKK